MKYLLDTHTFIWFTMDPAKLSKKVCKIIEDGDNEIFISPISFWEIAIKHQLGKINLGNINIFHLPNIASEYDFSILPIDAYDYITFHSLPRKEGHQDPFDQMLVHSALRKNLILISGDKSFKQYETEGLQLMW